MGPANERWCYNVTSFLTGWSHTQNDPCKSVLYYYHKDHIDDLNHWAWVTHICVSILTITGSDNGLLPGWRQDIIWTSDGKLLIWPLGINFSEILFVIDIFSLKKLHLKMSCGKWRSFCFGLNELMQKWSDSNALAMELHLSCIKLLICDYELIETWALIQYKDVIASVLEIMAIGEMKWS